jgi:hypothetical protein
MNERRTVGISISEPDKNDLGKLGKGLVHLQDAMVESARFLLTKGFNLAYGGDLNYEGAFNFTELLFELARTYGGDEIRVTNYAAFPLYTKITLEREVDFVNSIQIKRVNPPSPLFTKWLDLRYQYASADERQYLDDVFEAKSDDTKKIWAESLTEMRSQMTQNIQCRIVMGGKTQNFKGSMPGIFEETLMCLKWKIPVLVDGRFGGAAKQIVDEVLKRRPDNEKAVITEFIDVKEGYFKKIAADVVLFKGHNNIEELENLSIML